MIAETDGAVKAAEEALQRGACDPHTYALVAWGRAERGNVDAALALLAEGRGFSPDDPELLTTIATLLRGQGRLRDAILHCDAAIQSRPVYAPAWLERGYVFATGGSIDSATSCYRQVLHLEPENAAALAAMASVSARHGDSTEGRLFAERALQKEPNNLIAASALATMDIEAGSAEKARDILLGALDGVVHPSGERSTALGLLGDAYDRIDECDLAFEAYASAKQDFAALHALKLKGRQGHADFIKGVEAQMSAFERLPPIAGEQPVNAAANHIFLLGYPRSGTTLVENILASLPGVVALEERATLAAADADFLAEGEGEGLCRFAALDDQALQPYRQAYWNKVAEAGADVAGKVFVDMDPLKGIRLPMIARLFPDAKIVVMRRDPRDCVWSCFHTSFALSSAALEFVSLEQTARHYDALMSLTGSALSSLPINAHILRYDALVHDFEGATRSLCAFLGLEWSAKLKDFDRTAQKRGVSTASAGQVRKGLYDGTRQWERYRAQMEPVLPILQPWVEQFGFLG